MKKLFIATLVALMVSLTACTPKMEKEDVKAVDTPQVESQEETQVEEEETTEGVEEDTDTEVKDETVVEEQPKVEEPVSEKPAIEQPVSEKPIVEQPIVEEQPKVEEPVVEEPIVQQPQVKEEPVVEQPKAKSTGLMTPYPTDYLYLPENYDKEAILNWWRHHNIASLEENMKWISLNDLEAYDCTGYGKDTLVAVVEWLVDKGYNPWGMVNDFTTTTCVAIRMNSNYDNSTDLTNLINHTAAVYTFDEQMQICIDDGLVKAEKVPQ